MSHTNGAIKKSLFIQVAWFNPQELKEQLEHVRAYHKDRSKDDYIYNVVLDEISNTRSLSSNLEIIVPYLPGGRLRTFDNVFIGSHYVKWRGGGSSYTVGMANSTHRWANLKVQKRLWKQFAARYDSIPFHFYINHEGVLNAFDIPKVRRGYEAYLIQSVRDAQKIRLDHAILWSPAVWSGVGLTKAELNAIRITFNNVKRYGGGRGVSWLHFQDMMGRGRADITKYDVLKWHHQLKKVYDWDSLRVNMEMFNQDAEELQAREDWYQSQGMAVGASWELRHWYEKHKEL